MNKKSNHYTLMFVPEDNGKTFTLRIPKYVLHSLLLFIIVLLTGLILLLYKSGEIAAKLQVLSLIRMENDKLNQENRQLRLVTEKMDYLDYVSKYLQRLAAPPNIATNVDNSSSAKDKSEQKAILKVVETSPVNKNQNVYLNSKYDKLSSFPNVLPVEGWITKSFSMESISPNAGHQGIDFAAALGTPIKSTAPGVVGAVFNDKYFGLMVTVNHENNYVTRYGHCSQILVSKHDQVQRGQTIAFVGNTGRSTAPHLHYEVIKDGKYMDPAKLFLVNKE